MLRLLFLLTTAAALGQVRTVNTLTEPPVAIATDAMGFVYMAANAFSADHPAIDHYHGHAVFSSSDFGITWTAAGDFPEDTVKGIAADPVNPGTLLVTGRNGIWKTKDAGAHWYRVLSYPAPSSTSPGDIAYDPTVPGHVLTVGYGSTDGGESWVPFTILAPTHWGPFAFDPKGNGNVFEGGGAGYRSLDGGRTWAALQASEPWRSFAFDPLRRGVVYGLGYTLSGVYVSADDGATFSAKMAPFQDGIDDLFADPAHPGRIYVTTGSGILYRSDDAATSWQQVYSGAGPYRSHLVRSCSALVFGRDNWTSVTRSLDDGNTWQTVGAGPSYRLTSGAGCKLYGSPGNTRNGYIAKYAPGGEKFVWGTYVSGDWPLTTVTSLAVAADGSSAVGGTSSFAGVNYAWVSKLDSAGHAIYSKTFGKGGESISAAAIDSTGAVWLSGTTSSASFPVTPDAFQSNLAGGSDAFLVKIDATGKLVYATYLGTKGDDAVTSITVDSKDRVVVGGYFSARSSILLGRLDPGTNRLDQFTEPGVSVSEGVDGIAIGADDSIYATGTTLSTVFPVTLPPFANPLNSATTLSSLCLTPGDRFLVRLNPDTLAPIYSRLFGAQCASSIGAGLQIRPDGTALVASLPDGTFPQHAEIAIAGRRQLAEVTPDGGALLFSSPLPCCEVGLALAPDGSFFAAGSNDLSLSKVTVPDPAPISVDHIGNAFSGTATGIAPRAIYTLTGIGIGPDTPIWLGFDAKDAPTELGGSRVLFGDTPAQLLYASANQLICLVPQGLQGSVTVQAEYSGLKSNPIQASVLSGDAGLLTTAFPGTSTQAYAENEDGSQNGPDHPAVTGSTVTFYGTGFPPLPAFMQSPVSTYPVSMTCQASAAQDQRFVAGLYRVPCQMSSSRSFSGTVPVALQMAREEKSFFGTIQVYFGNVVTIYVKPN